MPKPAVRSHSNGNVSDASLLLSLVGEEEDEGWSEGGEGERSSVVAPVTADTGAGARRLGSAAALTTCSVFP